MTTYHNGVRWRHCKWCGGTIAWLLIWFHTGPEPGHNVGRHVCEPIE